MKHSARPLSRIEKNALTEAIRLLGAEADSMTGYPANGRERQKLYRYAATLAALRYEQLRAKIVEALVPRQPAQEMWVDLDGTPQPPPTDEERAKWKQSASATPTTYEDAYGTERYSDTHDRISGSDGKGR